MVKMAALLKAVPGKDVREKVSRSCLCCCTWHGFGSSCCPPDLVDLWIQTMNTEDLHFDVVTTLTHTYILM